MNTFELHEFLKGKTGSVYVCRKGTVTVIETEGVTYLTNNLVNSGVVVNPAEQYWARSVDWAGGFSDYLALGIYPDEKPRIKAEPIITITDEQKTALWAIADKFKKKKEDENEYKKYKKEIEEIKDREKESENGAEKIETENGIFYKIGDIKENEKVSILGVWSGSGYGLTRFAVSSDGIMEADLEKLGELIKEDKSFGYLDVTDYAKKELKEIAERKYKGDIYEAEEDGEYSQRFMNTGVGVIIFAENLKFENISWEEWAKRGEKKEEIKEMACYDYRNYVFDEGRFENIKNYEELKNENKERIIKYVSRDGEQILERKYKKGNEIWKIKGDFQKQSALEFLKQWDERIENGIKAIDWNVADKLIKESNGLYNRKEIEKHLRKSGIPAKLAKNAVFSAWNAGESVEEKREYIKEYIRDFGIKYGYWVKDDEGKKEEKKIINNINKGKKR